MNAASFLGGLLGGGVDVNASRRIPVGLLGDGEVQTLPDISVGSTSQPGDDAHAFEQKMLNSGEPQLPQRDIQSEYDAYRQVQSHLPFASTFKAFGALPDLNGGVQPGIAQELYNGDYKGALSDLFGLATTAGISRFVLPKILPKGRANPPNDKQR